MVSTTVGLKETGTYYTPPTLSDFLIYHLFKQYDFSPNISILEPSAGDGVFFKSTFENKLFSDRITLPNSLRLWAIERDKEAFKLLKKNTAVYGTERRQFKYLNKDYLEFQTKNKKKFDLIIGNPPYIKSQYLSKEQIQLCELIHKNSNLSLKKIKNIWTSFLVGGVQSLNDKGVLCYVLPAELLQVMYAKELREHLKQNFDRIEIFTFNELIFADIEQDVVVLICAKGQTPGVSFYHVDKLDDLKIPNYVEDHSNIHRETLDKWTNYILSDEELVFLDRLKQGLDLKPIKHYCRAEVGVVTAANNYFIATKEVANDKYLKKIRVPIIQKGMHLNTGATFTKTDLNALHKSGKPSYFLAFKDKDADTFPDSVKTYLNEGIRQGINQRYKCLLRRRWYVVPSVWVSDGFFTKRSNLYPRTFVNEANTLVTDSFYRIKMNEGRKIHDLVFSFYNSLTFIYAELEGRYYGGSVLELMPNEYKNLPVPYYENVPLEVFEKMEVMLRANANISDILKYTNKVLLSKVYHVSDTDIDKLNGIYQKLLRRRLKKHTYSY